MTVELSPRELVCSALFVNGARKEEIGSILGIAKGTVMNYLKRAREKYRLQGRDPHNATELEKCLAWDIKPGVAFVLIERES